MASTIIIKNGTEDAPSSLAAGELAINTTDGGIYYGSTGGTSVSSSFKFGAVTASVISSSGIVVGGSLRADNLTAGRVAFVGTDGLLVDDSDLTFATATLSATNVTATNLTATTLQTHYIRSNSGTAAASIDDDEGIVTIAKSVLTTTDINGGTIDGATITIGGENTLDVSGGTLTTSAAQKLAILQGASSHVDIGAYIMRASILRSDVSTGTAPLTIASTTVVANLNADKLDGADLVDEDDMASNSATKVPTQQSVKAYADTKVSSAAHNQLTHHMIKDDIGTGVVYIGLQEADAENSSISNKYLPFLAPVAGKLLKIFVRTTVDMSGADLTWRLYTRGDLVSTGGNAAEIGAKTSTGPTTINMATYDFTTGVTGTNVIRAGDKVEISVQANATSSDSLFLITCLWEWDLS